MTRLFTLIRNVLILLITSIFVIWIIISRPINLVSGTYEPDHIVSTTSLKAHTQFLSENLAPRNSANPDKLFQAAKYIKRIFNKSSNNVSLKHFKVNGKNYANVIAQYGPDSDAVIIIGAHYDAYSVFPGADDNASGVAGLLELGKLIATLDLKTRIELIAYTLEEPPIFATPNMGSAQHAAGLRLTDKKVKIMISLEMIGYFSDLPGSQHYPAKLLSLLYPNTGNFIAVVDQVFSNQAQGVKSAINRFTDLPAYSINAPAFIPGIDFSDHRNYWFNNYPAVMVTDTSFYRNTKYHTNEDTYDRLDYLKMAKVIYGIFKYVQEIDAD